MPSVLQVLRKSPSSKVVTPDDVFEPNTSFSCQLLRVRIPMASLEESQTHEKVEEDRTYAIEACIVSAAALSCPVDAIA